MGTIYRRAEEVIAWLGVEENNSSTAFAFIKQMTDSGNAAGMKDDLFNYKKYNYYFINYN